MSGKLDEMAFDTLKAQKQSPQSSLIEYSDDTETYIAVVSRPRSGIAGYADEVNQTLGMPSWALQKFLARRSGYRTNSAIDDPHNQAYVDMNLRSIYQRHLQKDAVTSEVKDLAERVIAGENITLVCYESGGDKCHRHLLIEKIQERVESRENCGFKLSV